jgi:hypothetical protein
VTSGAGPSIIARAAANIRNAERVSIGNGNVESPSGDNLFDFAFSHASRNFAFAFSSVAAVPLGNPPAGIGPATQALLGSMGFGHEPVERVFAVLLPALA